MTNKFIKNPSIAFLIKVRKSSILLPFDKQLDLENRRPRIKIIRSMENKLVDENDNILTTADVIVMVKTKKEES